MAKESWVSCQPGSLANASADLVHRWYRAPEILLGSNKYDTAVDLWSLGCIFGEMLGGKPVFPGTSTLNQIEKIGELIGAPSGDDMGALQSTYVENMLDQMLFLISAFSAYHSCCRVPSSGGVEPALLGCPGP